MATPRKSTASYIKPRKGGAKIVTPRSGRSGYTTTQELIFLVAREKRMYEEIMAAKHYKTPEIITTARTAYCNAYTTPYTPDKSLQESPVCRKRRHDHTDIQGSIDLDSIDYSTDSKSVSKIIKLETDEIRAKKSVKSLELSRSEMSKCSDSHTAKRIKVESGKFVRKSTKSEIAANETETSLRNVSAIPCDTFTELANHQLGASDVTAAFDQSQNGPLNSTMRHPHRASTPEAMETKIDQLENSQTDVSSVSRRLEFTQEELDPFWQRFVSADKLKRVKARVNLGKSMSESKESSLCRSESQGTSAIRSESKESTSRSESKETTSRSESKETTSRSESKETTSRLESKGTSGCQKRVQKTKWRKSMSTLEPVAEETPLEWTSFATSSADQSCYVSYTPYEMESDAPLAREEEPFQRNGDGRLSETRHDLYVTADSDATAFMEVPMCRKGVKSNKKGSGLKRALKKIRNHLSGRSSDKTAFHTLAVL